MYSDSEDRRGALQSVLVCAHFGIAGLCILPPRLNYQGSSEEGSRAEHHSGRGVSERMGMLWMVRQKWLTNQTLTSSSPHIAGPWFA